MCIYVYAYIHKHTNSERALLQAEAQTGDDDLGGS